MEPTQPRYITPDEGDNRGPKPWERQPRETDQDWAYFQLFLQQGWPEGYGGAFQARNLSELARQVGVARETLAKRSSDFHWPQRVGAWDREVEVRKSNADLTEIARSRSRWARIVGKARTLGEQELDKLLAKSTQDVTLPTLQPKESLAILEWAQKAERALVADPAKGEALPEDKDINLEDMELEELEALHTILETGRARTRARTDSH